LLAFPRGSVFPSLLLFSSNRGEKVNEKVNAATARNNQKKPRSFLELHRVADQTCHLYVATHPAAFQLRFHPHLRFFRHRARNPPRSR
jgi:hypothetical protein